MHNRGATRWSIAATVISIPVYLALPAIDELHPIGVSWFGLLVCCFVVTSLVVIIYPSIYWRWLVASAITAIVMLINALSTRSSDFLTISGALLFSHVMAAAVSKYGSKNTSAYLAILLLIFAFALLVSWYSSSGEGFYPLRSMAVYSLMLMLIYVSATIVSWKFAYNTWLWIGIAVLTLVGGGIIQVMNPAIGYASVYFLSGMQFSAIAMAHAFHSAGYNWASDR